jgi:transposase
MNRKRSQKKREALREQGALHAHPDRVADPLFEDGGFFDPEDVVQVKYEMLRRAGEEGMTVSDAASAFGFSRPSFYKALADFEAEGLPGLVARKRGPRGAFKLTEEVLAFVGQLRTEDPSMSPAALAEQVLEGFGKRIHPRTIERALAGTKKKRPASKQRPGHG